MRYNNKFFALETILNLYKDNKIDIMGAVKLIRGVTKGMGIKEAKEIIDKIFPSLHDKGKKK